MGDIWCYLALICPYFVEGTGWNRLDDKFVIRKR